MRTLVVTAVAAERDAIGTVTDDDVIVCGVGPAAAAAATAGALAGGGYDLVLSAGIGGGFQPVAPGQLAVACDIVFADLGAETAEGFRDVEVLGFGTARYPVAPALAVAMAECTGGHLGSILTVATVTGSAARARALSAAHPDAVAEAMEGAGVAAAAALHGVAVCEIRAISNAVGPRDRGAWRVEPALAALATAIDRLRAARWRP